MPSRQNPKLFIQAMYQNSAGVWTPRMIPITKFVSLNDADLGAIVDAISPADLLPMTNYGGSAAVIQASSKATGVTLNLPSGQITMNNAALNAGVIVSFVLTSSAIAAGDVITLNHLSGGTLGSYGLNGRCANGSATIDVRNNTAANLSEALVLLFKVEKANAA